MAGYTPISNLETGGNVRGKINTQMSELFTGMPALAGTGIATTLGEAELVQTIWDFNKAIKTPPNLLREMIETASGGAATSITDDMGYPSMMFIALAKNSGYLHTDLGPADAISSALVTAGGTMYSVNDILTIDGKTGTARVLTLGAGGAVATVEVVNPGSTYTAGTGKTTTVAPAGGSGCTITIAIGGPIFPSHMVNGVFKPEIYLPMFNATKYGSGADARAVVWPGLYPETALSGGFDSEKPLCTNKGTGWHMMTWWENAYLEWMSMKMATEPRGNTYYGRAYESGYEYETGVRFDGLQPGVASGTGKHRNGSGPVTWSHNRQFWGVHDLNGNVWRRLDGMKINDGLIYLPDDNYYGLAEASWPAVHGALGEAVYFDNTTAGSGGAPRLSNSMANALTNPNYSSIAHTSMAMTTTEGYDALDLTARRKMLRAGIALRLTQAGSNPFAPKGTVFLRNYGERLPFVGGSWYSASYAGLAALLLHYARSGAYFDVGFRPCYIP